MNSCKPNLQERAGTKRKLTILSDIKDWRSRTAAGPPNQTTSQQHIWSRPVGSKLSTKHSGAVHLWSVINEVEIKSSCGGKNM